jgi:hypothetical protein
VLIMTEPPSTAPSIEAVRQLDHERTKRRGYPKPSIAREKRRNRLA